MRRCRVLRATGSTGDDVPSRGDGQGSSPRDTPWRWYWGEFTRRTWNRRREELLQEIAAQGKRCRLSSAWYRIVRGLLVTREQEAESLTKDNIPALVTWWVAALVRKAQTSAAARLAPEEMRDAAPQAPERPRSTSMVPFAVKASFKRRHGITGDTTGAK